MGSSRQVERILIRVGFRVDPMFDFRGERSDVGTRAQQEPGRVIGIVPFEIAFARREVVEAVMRGQEVEREMRIGRDVGYDRRYFVILFVVEIERFTQWAGVAKILVRHFFRDDERIRAAERSFQIAFHNFEIQHIEKVGIGIAKARFVEHDIAPAHCAGAPFARKTRDLLDLGKLVFQLRRHENGHRWRYDLFAAHQHIIVNPVNAVFISVETIKTQFVADKQHDEQERSQPDAQPGDVEEREQAMLRQATKSSNKVILYHRRSFCTPELCSDARFIRCAIRLTSHFG